MDSTTEALIQRAKATMTPNYNPAPFIAERGEGIRLFSKSGDSFLDFSSGIAVTSLGHSHPEVVEAVRAKPADSSTRQTSFTMKRMSTHVPD